METFVAMSMIKNACINPGTTITYLDVTVTLLNNKFQITYSNSPTNAELVEIDNIQEAVAFLENRSIQKWNV